MKISTTGVWFPAIPQQLPRQDALSGDVADAAVPQVLQEAASGHAGDERQAWSDPQSGASSQPVSDAMGELVQRMRFEVSAAIPDQQLDWRASRAITAYQRQQDFSFAQERQDVSRMMGVDFYA